MKKVTTLILGLCISSISVMASGDEAEKIYKALKDSQHEVFSMSLAKEMIDFFDMDIDFNGNEQVIKGDFKEGKLLILDKGMKPSEVLKLFKKADYRLVELDNEDEDEMDDSEIFLYVKGKSKNIEEAHFIIDEEEKTIVFSVFGDIQVNKK